MDDAIVSVRRYSTRHSAARTVISRMPRQGCGAPVGAFALKAMQVLTKLRYRYRDRNKRLTVARPRPVQRNFEPSFSWSRYGLLLSLGRDDGAGQRAEAGQQARRASRRNEIATADIYFCLCGTYILQDSFP